MFKAASLIGPTAGRVSEGAGSSGRSLEVAKPSVPIPEVIPGGAGCADVAAAASSMLRARESIRLVAALEDSSLSGRAARSGAGARSIGLAQRGQRLRAAFAPAGTFSLAPHAPHDTVAA